MRFEKQHALHEKFENIFSNPYFTGFRLKIDIYRINGLIQFEYRKIRTIKLSIFGNFSVVFSVMFSFMGTDDPDSAETQVSFLLSLASLIIEVLTLNTNIYMSVLLCFCHHQF